MVRIRLRRVGGKKQASFRIVAADKESPRDGRFIEILGFYNPRTEPATIDLKEDRIYDWMSKGAQPSDSAVQLFQTIGLTERYERFKNGEKVETLVAEAEAANAARNVSPRTRYPAPVGKPKKKEETAPAEAPKAEEKETEEAVEAPAEVVEEEKAEVKAEEKETEEVEPKAEEAKSEEVAEETPKNEEEAEEEAKPAVEEADESAE